MAPKAQPLDVRFWRYVDKSDADGCWTWTASYGTHGYGMFYPDRNTKKCAHRFSYELAFGKISSPLVLVCHTCDNRRCVRPDHLFLGTHAENAADMIAKRRSATGDKNGSRRHPEKLKRGADHPGVKNPERLRRVINEDKAALIKGMRKAGVPLAEVARRVGCSYSIAFNVVNEVSWKRVQPIEWWEK